MLVKNEFQPREEAKVTGFTFDFETGEVILFKDDEYKVTDNNVKTD